VLQRAVAQAGGRIDAFFFCPHAADAGCECRKPMPGMLREIARRFNVALGDVYMVGDAQRDLEAAAAAGAKPALVLTGKGEATRAEGRLPPGTEVFPDLAAFALRLAP
jgi:D-glycero-D-manno-heptose 1,7-bisphosphate phosphatase